MTELRLSLDEEQMLAGEAGPATQLAMRVLVALGTAARARRMVAISSAHIDGCLYHGRAGLDFATRLASGGGRVRVPTTLNVSSLDLLHPDLVRLPDETRREAKELMDAYLAMGGRPTWTCAPYQLPERPAPGAQVAWGESNAIFFANSVLGARTERYGDFSDICAAIAGRVPLAGLHTDAGRRARVAFELPELSAEAWLGGMAHALVGHAIGRRAGMRVPAIVGLPSSTTEDQLKALGAAAASSGAVALCHVVGVTPEAGTLAEATGRRQVPIEQLSRSDLLAAWHELASAAEGTPIQAISLGTPHMSLAELEHLGPQLAGLRPAPGVTVYVSTGRDQLAELERRAADGPFRRPGIQLVVDTCTYVTPILGAEVRTVMTDSAKWAWYAPANLGVEACFGSLADCLRSAEKGMVARERPRWLDG